MPEVKDYKSGRILTLIKIAFALFGWLKTPIAGSMAKAWANHELGKCRPKKVSSQYAEQLILKAGKCAVGQRVCNSLYSGADHGQSVFLDELAEAMVEKGKASFVDAALAVQAINLGRKGPIMLTRVSGKYMEICRSIPKNCVYWNSEKHGLKCIERITA